MYRWQRSCGLEAVCKGSMAANMWNPYIHVGLGEYAAV